MTEPKGRSWRLVGVARGWSVLLFDESSSALAGGLVFRWMKKAIGIAIAGMIIGRVLRNLILDLIFSGSMFL
jgi:hypothetical protein